MQRLTIYARKICSLQSSEASSQIPQTTCWLEVKSGGHPHPGRGLDGNNSTPFFHSISSLSVLLCVGIGSILYLIGTPYYCVYQYYGSQH